jgi:hypothetical protein
MWNVNPGKMCSKHLIGEHLEMHMFVGNINKGRSIKGYIDKGLVETQNIRWRHDILVREMLRRGLKHNSPLPEFKCEPDGVVDRIKNEIILYNRCIHCKSLMDNGGMVNAELKTI